MIKAGKLKPKLKRKSKKKEDKKDNGLGYPRYKSFSRWHTFGFAEFYGIRLIDNKVRIKGIKGGIKVHFHRPLPNTNIKSCNFTNRGDTWYICFHVEVKDNILPKTGQSIGLDMGISKLVTLSDGTEIRNLKLTKKFEKELRRKKRMVSRCKKGSKSKKKKNKQVDKLYLKIKNTRSTYMHQVSSKLIKEYDLISIEDLNIEQMASGDLGKEIYDAGWGMLKQYIKYKAARAGKQVVLVDPSYTSQTLWIEIRS